jgi:hypothetical protein
MRRGTIRWLTGGLATILALVVSATVVQGGYTPPSQSGSLLDEVSAFVGDFGQWNASLNNLPMEILASTPSAEQGEVVFLLFWFWLQDSATGPAEKATSSSPSGSTSLASLALPPSSGNPSNSSLGSIVMSQLGNDPPSFSSNNGNDPPSLLSNGGGVSGQQFGSIPLLGGGHAGDSGTNPMSPDADPMPAPASFTLLAIGGSVLLLGLWKRRRRFDCSGTSAAG